MYDHHFNDADWFLKADDDSFVILENLRYFLSKHNSSQQNYFGRHLLGDFNSGGAGYVFSKASLLKFNQALQDPSRCKQKSLAEDVEVGVCLRNMGVLPGDTRDEFGRETFHPLKPENHVIPNGIDSSHWLYQNSKYPLTTGRNSCSDHTIAFHYITPGHMHLLDYFIYHLRPYGVHHDLD